MAAEAHQGTFGGQAAHPVPLDRYLCISTARTVYKLSV